MALGWKEIPGYEKEYEASTFGEIRALDRFVTCGNGQRLIRGRMLPATVDNRGRLRVSVRSQWKPVHVLVAITFLGPKPEGLEILHYDDNPLNNLVSNLRYGTHSENMEDRNRNGWNAFGSGSFNRSKESCPLGHSLVSPNLRNSGNRGCRACHQAQSTKQLALKSGVTIDFESVANAKYAKIMKDVVTC